MNYKLPLLFSAVLINSVHASLLLVHKINRKWTISEHAVLGRKSYYVYIVGHFINGALFLVFAHRYFVGVQGLNGLFVLSFWTAGFEWLQALLPAKGKTNKLHTITALIMWVSFIFLGLLCIVFLPVALVRKVTACLIYGLLFISLVYGSTHRQKLYTYQMVMVLLFYAAIMALVI